MWSLYYSWLLRKTANQRPRRSPSSPGLRLEELEDRLAPAGLLPVPPATPTPLQGPNEQTPRQAHFEPISHPFLTVVLLRHALDRNQPLLPNDQSHPFLSALVSGLLNLNLGGTYPRFMPDTFTGDLSTLAATPSFVLASTALSSPVSSSFQHGLVANAGVFVGPPSGQPGNVSGNPPLTIDPPSFPSAKPSRQKSAPTDAPPAFELSPIAPLGLGIVPVPVPRGLEESLADLFGNPPPPTPSPRSVDDLPFESSNADPDAMRAAVLQMLHANAASSVAGGLDALRWMPPAAAPFRNAPAESGSLDDTISPPALPDGTITAGTPLDPPADGAGETLPRSTPARSFFTLFAAGAGIVLRHLRSRRTRRLQAQKAGVE